MAQACSMFCVQFSSPFLTIYVYKTYKVKDEQLSLLYLGCTLPYLIMAILLPCTFSRYLPKRMLFVLGLFVSAVGMGFLGSTELFFLEDGKYWHVLAGLIVIGSA